MHLFLYLLVMHIHVYLCMSVCLWRLMQATHELIGARSIVDSEFMSLHGDNLVQSLLVLEKAGNV